MSLGFVAGSGTHTPQQVETHPLVPANLYIFRVMFCLKLLLRDCREKVGLWMRACMSFQGMGCSGGVRVFGMTVME